MTSRSGGRRVGKSNYVLYVRTSNLILYRMGKRLIGVGAKRCDYVQSISLCLNVLDSELPESHSLI